MSENEEGEFSLFIQEYGQHSRYRADSKSINDHRMSTFSSSRDETPYSDEEELYGYPQFE
jgi:hypothetical protein